jgi:hypothetical protein
MSTVAILAQGTSWADAATQAFLHGLESQVAFSLIIIYEAYFFVGGVRTHTPPQPHKPNF